MKEPTWLSKELVLAVHERSLAEHGGAEGLRDEGLLESALNRPINLFHYEKPTLFTLAAAYAFALSKNHPFIDGNKRTAFVAAAAFLDTNGYELTATEIDATIEMLALAAGDRSEQQFSAWLKRNSKRIPSQGAP
jgi:death-on-curing protein